MNPITFPGLGLTFHIQRVAFQIFGKDIYWYGITRRWLPAGRCLLQLAGEGFRHQKG